jgi:hypothetical protein
VCYKLKPKCSIRIITEVSSYRAVTIIISCGIIALAVLKVWMITVLLKFYCYLNYKRATLPLTVVQQVQPPVVPDQNYELRRIQVREATRNTKPITAGVTQTILLIFVT